MARYKLRLNHDGMAEVLKSDEVAEAVHALAKEIADALDLPEGSATDVAVDDYTTDRAASSVTIKRSDALALQAKRGLLTRAAAAIGLEVKEYPDE